MQPASWIANRAGDEPLEKIPQAVALRGAARACGAFLRWRISDVVFDKRSGCPPGMDLLQLPGQPAGSWQGGRLWMDISIDGSQHVGAVGQPYLPILCLQAVVVTLSGLRPGHIAHGTAEAVEPVRADRLLLLCQSDIGLASSPTACMHKMRNMDAVDLAGTWGKRSQYCLIAPCRSRAGLHFWPKRMEHDDTARCTIICRGLCCTSNRGVCETSVAAVH